MANPTDQNLRALRSLVDRMRLPVREAARIVGMDHTTLNTWVNGTSKPRGEKGAEALTVAVRTLAARERETGAERAEGLIKVGIRLVEILPRRVVDKKDVGVYDGDMVEVMDWGTQNLRHAFVIEDDAMFPEIKVSETVIVEDRESEPNHVVLIEHGGERMVRLQRGKGAGAVYLALDDGYPEIPASGTKLVGVVMERVIPLPGDEELRHKYRHGMRARK